MNNDDVLVAKTCFQTLVKSCKYVASGNPFYNKKSTIKASFYLIFY